jgi:hypothetical protein
MNVNGTNLEMIRGDTEVLTVSCVNSEGEPINFETGDKVYFTVKESVTSTLIIFQKIITEFVEGKAIITILPEDTKNLKFKPYVYDVQLTQADGTVTTIVPPSSFVVGSEVTYE